MSETSPEHGVAPADGSAKIALIWGIIAAIPIGTAPLLLAELVTVGTITPPIIGITMFAELIGMAVGSVAGRYVLDGPNQRSALLGVLAVLVALNFGSHLASDWGVVLIRSLAGIVSGFLIWLAVQAILKTDKPEFYSAIMVTGQTVIQFLIAALLAGLVIPIYGAFGGYGAIAFTTACSALLIVPFKRVHKYIAPKALDSRLSLSSVAALLSIGTFMAVLSTVLSYAETSLMARGIERSATLSVVPTVLGAQVLGGLIATYFSQRLRSSLIVTISIVMLSVTVVALGARLPIEVVYLFLALFGFIWLFVAPFQVGWLLSLDTTRKAASLNPLAQLGGLALGPLGAAFVLGAGGNPHPAYALTLMGLSFIFLMVVFVSHRQTATP